MKTCVFTFIRNEHEYIEEWIEYNKNLGFDNIILIEDWNSKPHDSLIKKYGDFIKFHKMLDIADEKELDCLHRGVFRQRIAYMIFLRLYREQYDWMAFIDVDEYIDATKEELQDMFERAKDSLTIKLIWKLMKCNGHIKHPNNWQKYSLIETYTDYTDLGADVKCIINCRDKFKDQITNEKFEHLPHWINFNNMKNNVYVFPLKHFLYKSFEEWLQRFVNKGETHKANWNRQVDEWFSINWEFFDDKEKLYKEYNVDPKINAVTNDFPNTEGKIYYKGRQRL